MNYDVFVSYSVTFSSRAYELSAQLGRENLMCYLDCVESGFSLNDYTRGLLSESRIHVVLAGPGFVTTPYAMASLQCTVDEQKTVLMYLADGVKLPGELLEHCMVSSEVTLVDDIVSALKDVSDACVYVPPTTPIESAMAFDPVESSEPETEASTFTYAPFFPADEEEPFDASPWAAAASTIYSVGEGQSASKPDEDELEYAAEAFDDLEAYADDEDDEEEQVVCTEHRGEEWESLPSENTPSQSEISPELQKFLKIIGWAIFVFWLVRLCS